MQITYPENFEDKVGFSQIRRILTDLCKGKAGKELVENMSFSVNYKEIKFRLSITDEMIHIVNIKNDFPELKYSHTKDTLKKLSVSNYSLQLHDIVVIRDNLELLRKLKHFYKKQKPELYPLLKKHCNNIVFPDFVLNKINTCISSKGEIKDSATPELKAIRADYTVEKNKLIKTTNSILQKIRKNGWIDEDLSATYVNGRLVLPIASTHKRKIKALVHDVSATGKTSYIEPQEVIDINNGLRELELKEKRETEKILMDLTKAIRPYSDNLKSISYYLGELDFIMAKALFAIKTKSIIPSVTEKPCLELDSARHPLLYLKIKDKTVPNGFTLNENSRILVVSGPNAGGKSVALKTAGIISYMTQCGLPVPVRGTSLIGIFEKFFIDVGDDQSIENDLSTYSSHLLNMKFFLKNADNKTLVLIDEFGAGTDPLIGGTIAESILEELNKKKVFGFITTHYSNLKVFAANNEGIENAAMMIDNTKMKALFVLEQGKPGSSYAIEIAQRTGLPANIIDQIKSKTGQDNTKLDKFIRDTLRDKKYWDRKRKKIKEQEKKLEATLEKYIKELEEISKGKKKIINEAKAESQNILKSVNKKIENAIKEIKEAEADKEVTGKIRSEIESLKNEISEKKSTAGNELDETIKSLKIRHQKISTHKQTDKKESQDTTEIKIGDKVKISGQSVVGEVVEINKKNIVICYGNIYTTVPVKRAEKVSKKSQNPQSKSTGITSNVSEAYSNFKPYIDIRGKRVEETIPIITELIDNAVMLNFQELKILHGKGDGILRQHIRQFLKTFPEVKECYSEDVRFGGDGITIVKLK